MVYTEIESRLKDDRKIANLIKEYRPLFDRIEYYADLFSNKSLNHIDDIDEAMVELTGIFVSVHEVEMTAEAQKIAREEEFKEYKRQKIVKDINLDLINTYRRVRNIFKSASDACEKMISVCQSRVRYITKEEHLKYE